MSKWRWHVVAQHAISICTLILIWIVWLHCSIQRTSDLIEIDSNQTVHMGSKYVLLLTPIMWSWISSEEYFIRINSSQIWRNIQRIIYLMISCWLLLSEKWLWYHLLYVHVWKYITIVIKESSRWLLSWLLWLFMKLNLCRNISWQHYCYLLYAIQSLC